VSEGASEDLILVPAFEWDEKTLAALEERQQLFDIAREGRLKEYVVHGAEYPDAPRVAPNRVPELALSRKERRKLAREQRRRRR
jgi:hypothetical protein